MKPAFLVINKPPGVTSHDVVAAVRAVTGIKKVGHTGTLDPFATGVLPLALGGATRLIQYLDESIKVYDATIQLGSRTDTGDPTGEVIATADIPEITEDQILKVLAGQVGEQMQEPPAYSAVKVDGRPLYSYARKGEVKRAKPRKITIYDMELMSFIGDQIRVKMSCSRGTYARVLADDIAIALGTAGHLIELSRLRSGPFFLDDALSIEALGELVALEEGIAWRDVLMSRVKGEDRVKWKPRNTVRDGLIPFLSAPISALSHLPLADVDDAEAKRVRNGGPPPVPPAGTPMGGRYLVVCGNDLVTIAEAGPNGPKSIRVVPA